MKVEGTLEGKGFWDYPAYKPAREGGSKARLQGNGVAAEGFVSTPAPLRMDGNLAVAKRSPSTESSSSCCDGHNKI
jgi:hypothetical protein